MGKMIRVDPQCPEVEAFMCLLQRQEEEEDLIEELKCYLPRDKNPHKEIGDWVYQWKRRHIKSCRHCRQYRSSK